MNLPFGGAIYEAAMDNASVDNSATIGLSCPDVADQLKKLNANMEKLIAAIESLADKSKV